ncbi:hypothetical protein Tco_1484260 [Tanacetum coccineum]
MRISRIYMLYMNCIGCFLSRIMNPQETEQVIARDELWVPTAERVNISTTNVRLETTVKQKEEAFQVVIDVIKNSILHASRLSTISVNSLSTLTRVLPHATVTLARLQNITQLHIFFTLSHTSIQCVLARVYMLYAKGTSRQFLT